MSQEPIANTTSTSTGEAHLLLADIIIGERHRHDLGRIDELANSIKAVGLLHPFVVTRDKRLIAGRRRLEAVKELGWPDVPVRVVDGLDDALVLLRAERDENECRKAFTPSEVVAIGAALERMEKCKSRECQQEGGRKGAAATNRKLGKKQETPSGNFPEADKGETRDKVAEAVGMSGRTYEKAKAVVAASKDDPEQCGDLVKEMDATGKVDPAYKEMKSRLNTDLAVQSWRQRPGETGAAWTERLQAVPDKDKKGRKKAFDHTLSKAKRAFDKERREADRHMHFDLDREKKALCDWLIRRRQQWPIEHRSAFARIVAECLDRLANEEGRDDE